MPIRCNPRFALMICALFCFTLVTTANASSIQQAKQHIEAQNYAAAVSELEPLANSGNVEANNMLGLLYWQGDGVTANQAKARAYFEVGARSGHTESLKNLNLLLNVGYEARLQDIRPQAEAGDSVAQNRLGRMLEFGLGVDANAHAAFVWYQKSAAQNNLNGIMNLARAYNFGIDVSQDLPKAEELYLKGAQQGHVNSMFFLGTMHFAKLSQAGADADRQAYAWLKLAADLGHQTAATMVSRLTIKLGNQLDAGEALYKEYKQTYGN